MRRSTAFVPLLFLTASLFGATGEEVIADLQKNITIAHVSAWTGSIGSPGTPLVVQQDGIVLGERGNLNKKTVIKNGEMISAGGGVMGGGLFGGGDSGHALKRGDKVYLYEIHPNAKKDGVWFKIMGVDTYDTVKNGKTVQQHGDLLVEFYYDKPLAEMTSAEVLSDFGKWFKTEQEASESSTVKIGQTPAEVERILGPPDKRIDLGSKKIFVYKDMKIVFVDGKVSDVQ
jgi:hypothetical protein